MHHRNYPARPAVEVLEELVAKFRDLEWIPVRVDGSWSYMMTADFDGYDFSPNAYTDAKTILREQFGWSDNFDKEKWHRQRGAITERLLHPDEA